MTNGLTLKKPTADDLGFIQWLWSDPKTMDPVGGPITLDDEEAAKWFAKKVSPGSASDYYRLILNQDNIPVGEVSFHRLDLDTMTADFNIKIASKYRGQGYAKQAMYLFLDYFFNEFNGQIMIDKVAKNNAAGKKVLLDFGFVEDPSEEEFYFLRLSKKRFINFHQSQNEE